jgi:phthalate 4,5-dioxygenase
MIPMLSVAMNDLLTRVEKNAAMGDMISRFWQPAALSEELPRPGCPPIRVNLLGKKLVAFRDSSGKIGLLDSRCPHRSVDLFFGRNEQDGLRCVYHGWKFSTSGRCLDLPSEPPESRMKDAVTAKAYPVREAAGIIWAYVGPQSPPPELPDLELLDLPEGHVYSSKRLMTCNYMQALEGSIDTAHLTFLHRSMKPMEKDVFGVGDFQKFSDQDGAPKFFCSDTPYGMAISARRAGEDDSFYWRVTQWLMPLGVLVPTAPGSVCRANFFIPIDDTNCWWYRIRYHLDRPLTAEEVTEYESGDLDYSRRIPGTYVSEGNSSNDYLIDRKDQELNSFTGIASAQLQDIAIQESQGPIVDRSIERLGTSDTAIARCRRRMIEAAKSLETGVAPPEVDNGSLYRVRAVAMTLDKSWTAEDAANQAAIQSGAQRSAPELA